MIGRLSSYRFALAHDWLVSGIMRGGELVLDRLARLFGPTDLYTMVADGRPFTDAISACRVVVSPLQRFPGASGRLRRYYLPLMPWAVEHLKVGPCDVLISTSSCAMKGIRPPPETRHICFCHSPARYVWSQPEHYAHGLMGIGLRTYGPRFRRWDRATAGRVDLFLAPSSYVAWRIGRCFGRDAVVVAPPVRTDFFTPDPSVEREDVWLIVAALEPFKRIDLAIEAANRTGRTLLVAGTGSQARWLEGLAGPTVRFLGWQSAEQIRDLYRRCRAFLFPSIEDFGIAAVEALACGCPVVALRDAGALDTIDESCGAFMAEQSVEALIAASERLPDDWEACRRNAERFSAEAFDQAMIEQVESVLGITHQ